MNNPPRLIALSLLALVGCGPAPNVANRTSSGPTTETQIVEPASDAPAGQANVAKSTATSETPPPAEFATSEEEFEALKSEYDEKYSDFIAAYRAAKDDSSRQAAMEQMPNAGDYAGRFLAIADEHTGTEAAVDALVWITGNARGNESDIAKAKLLESYASNPKVAAVVMMMKYGASDASLEQLRGLIGSDIDQIQAAAKYALGSLLIEEDHTSAEALGLLQSVVDDFADVEISFGARSMKIAPQAAGELTEATKLQVGMVAPDIEGKDLDGVEFKLSDYRGKVVVLDFWGNW